MNIFQNNFSQKPIASFLIFTILCLIAGPVLFLPHKAQALAAGCPVIDIANTAVGKAQLGKYVGQSTLETIWQSATDVPTMLAAVSSELKDAWQKKWDYMEWGAGVMLDLMLHQVLAMLTNDIVNWIENGTEPRFLTEGIGDYLKEAVDNAAGNFISQYLGGGWLCEPFDLDIKFALLDVRTFETDAKCSISDIVDNIDDFYNDFSKGGWKGWIELTKPQNNFYGTLLLAQAEKNKVEAEAEEEAKEDAISGEGFLSIKDCKWYDAKGTMVAEQKNVRGTPILPEECKGVVVKKGEKPPEKLPYLPCTKKCQTKTPATVINELAKETVTDFQKTLRLQIAAATAKAGPFQVYVEAIANALVNRTMKEGFLLLTGQPEKHVSIPNYGDLGASEDIPEIISPEEIMQDKDNAISLLAQLNLIKQHIENSLLKEQKNNLAVLKLITPAYLDTIFILDQIPKTWPVGCLDTPYYINYISWAESKKNGIEENLIPAIKEKIDQLELVEIPKTIDTSNDVNAAMISIQDYTNKADVWLKIYENLNDKSNTNDPALKTAQKDMDEAENKVITDTQEVLKTINNTVSSINLVGLTQEVQNTISDILYKANDLVNQRGMAIWPEPGTLYADLEAAQALKDEANGKLNTCQNWIPPEEFY